MPLPREELLHHIWQHRLLASDKLYTTDGKSVNVLKTGTLNTNSGPDFLNSRVQIDGIDWVGNIEIHIRSSDWIAHNHQNDEAYSNIILHVVYEHNINEELGNFPTLELGSVISNQVLAKYQMLVKSEQKLPCAEFLPQISDLVKVSWLDSLLIQRLERKSRWMSALVEEFSGDLEQAFLVVMFRSFGMKVNAVPFELLGKHVSWKVLSKHQDNLPQLEAILFGVAGFLAEPIDDYGKQLKTEFNFLKHKYDLQELNPEIWKLMRLRPANFPTIRIAQLAALFHKVGSFYKWFSSVSISNLKLELIPSKYWETHYVLGKSSVNKPKKLGQSMLNNLYINAVVPFLFVVSKRNGMPEIQTKGFDILETLSPERNSKVSVFAESGLKAENAGDSQALIELNTNYCEVKKCLSCKFGSTILKRGL